MHIISLLYTMTTMFISKSKNNDFLFHRLYRFYCFDSAHHSLFILMNILVYYTVNCEGICTLFVVNYKIIDQSINNIL